MKYEICLLTKNTGSTLFEQERYEVSENLFTVIKAGCEIRGKKI